MIDTHPWIQFKIRLIDISIPTWILLGECVSKIHHIVGTPLIPAIAREMRQAFISKGIHGTAAIEGNTLLLSEVSQRLTEGLELPESQEYLGREIDNLEKAYGLLSEIIDGNSAPEISVERIKEYNRQVLQGLELDEDVTPGGFAVKQHGVANYRAPSPAAIRSLMPSLVAWLNDELQWEPPQGVPALAVTILKSIIAHLYVAWIHPFGDGNGRTSRLLEAEILARGGVPAISYHLLSDHYNRTRRSYYLTLAKTSSTLEGVPGAFVEYAVQGFAEGLRDQMKKIKNQHREVVWRDFVHDSFRGKDTVRYNRLRRLAMDLALSKKPVPKSELWSVSLRVKNSYHGKTQKTVSRDVNELQRMKLLVPQADGFVANLDILSSFMPPIKDDTSLFDQ